MDFLEFKDLIYENQAIEHWLDAIYLKHTDGEVIIYYRDPKISLFEFQSFAVLDILKQGCKSVSEFAIYCKNRFGDEGLDGPSLYFVDSLYSLNRENISANFILKSHSSNKLHYLPLKDKYTTLPAEHAVQKTKLPIPITKEDVLSYIIKIMEKHGFQPIPSLGEQVFAKPYSDRCYRLSFTKSSLIIESAENENDARKNLYEDSDIIPYTVPIKHDFLNIFEMFIVMFYKHNSVNSDFTDTGWIRSVTPDSQTFKYIFGETIFLITFDEVRGMFVCELEYKGTKTKREYPLSKSNTIFPDLCNMIVKNQNNRLL